MGKSKTAWKRMRFKKNKVWVALDAANQPLVESGKVRIKYQLEQSYEYQVHAESIQPLEPALPEQISYAAASPPSKTATGFRSTDRPRRKPSDHSSGSTTEAQNCENTICVFTDGASSGNPGPAGIGVLLRFGDHEKEISRYIGTATNNVAELEAIKVGLSEIKNKNLPVRIFTDSSYCLGVLSLSWKAKKNTALINTIKQMMAEFREIEIIKVKGHAGHRENERVDLLATGAIKSFADG